MKYYEYISQPGAMVIQSVLNTPSGNGITPTHTMGDGSVEYISLSLGPAATW